MGVFNSPAARFADGEECLQAIDADKRRLHSRLHTAGHVIGAAVNRLVGEGKLPADIRDGKASHYPSAAFVEFSGLIPGTAKDAIQAVVDGFVRADYAVSIDVWSEERAGEEWDGGRWGVRVVRIGEVGSYPCGGTHVERLGECGRVVVRNIKRQKGVSKIGYEVVDGVE
ncbi:Threonyl/alanyl tRNA synthetase [Phaeosphaeriaceae sp. PMI808]|nr:Threonyl/alanyl tRNA synthetase [Phaeosphaeriaceae sp. PMI808]